MSQKEICYNFLGEMRALPSSKKKYKNIQTEYLDWGDRRPDQLQPEAGFPHPLHHCRALQGSTSSVNNKSEKSARIRY